jgi:8-oxo-dGTP pyrophosphatase MutT (NUDIX family)
MRQSIFFKVIFFFYFIGVLSFIDSIIAAVGTTVSSKIEHVILTATDAQRFLKSSPIYHKDEKPQATVGVIPYTFIDGQIFFLLGRETKDKTWSDFGGKVETKDLSLGEALRREFYEETANAAELSEEVLSHSGTILLYLHKISIRQIVYAFVYMPHLSKTTVLNALKVSVEEVSKEKDQIRWFTEKELTEPSIYVLRKFFEEDLIKSPQFKAIMNKLRDNAFHKKAA